MDREPPRLMAFEPDSAAVAAADTRKLRFHFSEKMDRQQAISWLRTYPDLDIKKTKWSGAIDAEVEFFESLPADTVIVVELLPGMTDSHRVKSQESRRFPILTGERVFDGALQGQLVMADTVLSGAVVELYDVPPDTLEYFQQQILRRTVANDRGVFRFEWLPTPGGPWLMRAFEDADGNLRPGEKEAQRLLPDTLSVTVGMPESIVETVTLYPWDAPGTLNTGPFDAPAVAGPVGGWALAVADNDTGWVPAPYDGKRTPISWLDPVTGGALLESPPNRVRVVLFVDVDADSVFGAIPDTLWSPEVAGLTDTVSWYLEPWGLAEDIELEPGLSADFTAPAVGDSLVSWAAPPVPVLADTLVAAMADSAAVLPESSESPEATGASE